MKKESDPKKFDLKSWLSGYFTPALVLGGLVSMWVIAETRTLDSPEQKVELRNHLANTPTDVDLYVQGEKLIEVSVELNETVEATDSIFAFAKKITKESTKNQKDAIKSRGTRDSLLQEAFKIVNENSKAIKQNTETNKKILKKLDSLNPKQ